MAKKVSKDSLGDRMKNYEKNHKFFLTKRVPVILRVDGKAFHTLTRKHFGKGYSELFTEKMILTAMHLQKNIQGCELVYCQSDKITCLITDYRTINTNAWFDYEVNKMVSIAASLAASRFSTASMYPVEFNARVFNVPEDDVVNNFLWRQKDAIRNAINMTGQMYFSAKELHGKNTTEVKEMLLTKGINYYKLPIARRRGFCITKRDGISIVDTEIPEFGKDRDYIQKFVDIKED